MMTEILKPIFENNVLTDEIKEAIELSLTEALTDIKEATREEVEKEAKANFEAAKTKFEETYKTLEESYKTKLEEAKIVIESAKDEINELKSKIEDLEARPFVHVTEQDMENAEKTLTEEIETKYEAAFDIAKEKFNNTFDVISETNAEIVESFNDALITAEEENSKLVEKIAELEEKIKEQSLTESETENLVAEAIKETEEKMLAESNKRVEEVKTNLVTATEIFIEQELSELKADYKEMMKEKQGRELLESIKSLVKEYWDIDSEIAEEILEMKKSSDAKVEQYKEMLKKEHARLEEAQSVVEDLRKKVIVESKASVLSSDKKEALEKLAKNIESNQLESQIDSLMESVVDTFNAGFSKKEIKEKIEEDLVDNDKIVNESVQQTVISSGDIKVKSSDEVSNLLDLAGIRK